MTAKLPSTPRGRQGVYRACSVNPAVRDERTLRAYYVGYVAMLIATFTPFKALGYLLPLAFIAWMGLHHAVSRNRMFVIVAALLGAAAVYETVLDEFLLTNYLVACVTFSAFLPLWIIDDRLVTSRVLQVDMLGATSTMVLCQGVVGVIQALYGATQTGTFSGDNGDYVAGTIYPHLGAERAFSNPMFAVNMVFMLLGCLSHPEPTRRKGRTALLLGAIALVLASVMHVLVFLIAALVGAWILTRPRRVTGPRRSRGTRGILLLLAVVSSLSYFALSDNVALVTRVAERSIDLEAVDIPRVLLITQVFSELPAEEPLQPLIGLGPGQFSGRAALIMSGLYLGGPDNPKPLPLLSPQATTLSNFYCISLLIAMGEQEGDIGSSQQPFFSYMTVYTEAGLVGSVLVLLLFGRTLWRVRMQARRTPEARLQLLLFAAAVIFLFFLGWQAAYWETPQALFVGMLLLKVMHANLMTSNFAPTNPGGS
jgi:hypothetical protein